MENNNFDQENNSLGDYYFKVSYKGQNYKVTKEYQNWKKIMIEKYGKNGKEINCPKDYTIIYKIHNNNDESIKCPGCNSIFYNCIFCNKNQEFQPIDCCIISSLRYKVKNRYKEKFDYIFINLDENNVAKKYFKRLIIISFIPFTSAYPLISRMIFLLLDDKLDEIESCQDFFKALFFMAFMFIMSFIYGIIYYLIFISFFILSIPFKLFPVKLYFGLLITMESKSDDD